GGWRGALSLVPVAALLVAATPGKRLTLVFTGDDGGEIGPCGGKHNPSGGLARRKGVIDRLREQGPILMLDAGNALFKVPAGVDAAAKVRAEFLLKTMGTLGTVAMPAGLRDLAAGVDFLKKTAESAGVRVLSVNLTSKGKSLFPASM